MLDELSSQEKKYLYPIVAIIILILVIVLIIIWWPKNTKIQDNINKVNINNDYAEIQIEKYKNILNEYLIESNFSKLYSKISKEWLAENNIENENDAKNFLFKNYIISSSAPNILESEVFSSNDLYIFKFVIDTNGVKKNIYINESTPYEYTFSFEEYSINVLSGKNYKYTLDSVEYEIKTEYVSDSLIQYEITAKNKGSDTYTWQMKNYNKVFLKLNNEEKIISTDITALGLTSAEIKPGGELSFKVTFTIPLQKQANIESLRFENVYKNDYENNIEIPFNGGDK